MPRAAGSSVDHTDKTADAQRRCRLSAGPPRRAQLASVPASRPYAPPVAHPPWTPRGPGLRALSVPGMLLGGSRTGDEPKGQVDIDRVIVSVSKRPPVFIADFATLWDYLTERASVHVPWHHRSKT